LIEIYIVLWVPKKDPDLGEISDPGQVAIYSMLIFVGIAYTIGSYAFVRACDVPKKMPIFTWRHFATDELLGMWMFFWGTVPSVPVMIIVVYFYSDSVSYFVALVLAVIMSVLFLVASLCCYPDETSKNEPLQHWVSIFCPCLRRQEYLAPLLLYCIPNYFTSLRRHLANDWLIISWGILFCCAFSVAACAGLLYFAEVDGIYGQVYNYSTGLVDMIIFTVGSMYFLAGSYPDQDKTDALELTEVAAVHTKEYFVEELGEVVQEVESEESNCSRRGPVYVSHIANLSVEYDDLVCAI
jgi:hypothetical protein